MPLTAAATRPRAGPGTLDLQQRNSASRSNRYCGVNCRQAAWRERHGGDVVPAVLLAVPASFAFRRRCRTTSPPATDNTAVRAADKPLAIINVVSPADAAVVQPPEVPMTGRTTANRHSPPREDDLATPRIF
jgi:hypothetical protein